MSGTDLKTYPVHLGLGATATTEPLFTGSMDWYVDYIKRHDTDGIEGRLMAMHTFTASWDTWEMHPHGSEVVLCIAGEIVLHQEGANGSISTTNLSSGEYAINPSGVWHTADVQNTVTLLFITAGIGTQHRPR